MDASFSSCSSSESDADDIYLTNYLAASLPRYDVYQVTLHLLTTELDYSSFLEFNKSLLCVMDNLINQKFYKNNPKFVLSECVSRTVF